MTAPEPSVLPATPLPWKALPYKSGDRERAEIVQDDAFELHACNAYPQLVAALSQIAEADHPDYPHFKRGTEAEFSEHLMTVARTLLRALGEGK